MFKCTLNVKYSTFHITLCMELAAVCRRRRLERNEGMEAFLGELKDFRSNAELIRKPLKLGRASCQSFREDEIWIGNMFTTTCKMHHLAFETLFETIYSYVFLLLRQGLEFAPLSQA